MLDSHFFAESPESVGIDSSKLQVLLDRAEKEVREGLLPSAQIVVAAQGRIAAMRSIGRVEYSVAPSTSEGPSKTSAGRATRTEPASDETLYVVYSATKAIISSAAWLLIQDGQLRLDERVADIIPEFGSNGKQAVSVEQLFTHTAGFPAAPYPQREWNDRQARLERFASWRLDWEPGSRFIYHPTSSMWVVAEIIERRADCDYRDFVRDRIALPLALPNLRVGLPIEEQHRVANVVHVGEELTEQQRTELGWPAKIETEVSEPMLQGFNDPDVRRAGAPGAGGIMTAAELALFYQALLLGGRCYDGPPVWKPETIEMARQVRSGDLRDIAFGKPASRGLGLIISGDATRNFRGFGHTNSELAFGHNGAGGQLAWGDPANGISLGYCTNAHDRNELRQGRRGVGISSRAANCALDAGA